MAEDNTGYLGFDNSFMTPPFYQKGNEDRGASLIRELSPTEDLRDMIENFRGKIYDPNLKKYIIIDGVKPFMNADGIGIFFQYGTIMINKVVTMSNYTKNYKIIHALVEAVISDSIIHFNTHWQDYEISSKSKVKVITRKLLVLGLSSFYKALGAGERKAATANISETISRLVRDTPEQGGQKPKSFIERLFRR